MLISASSVLASEMLCKVRIYEIAVFVLSVATVSLTRSESVSMFQ